VRRWQADYYQVLGQVVHLLTLEQAAFFEHFGYDMAWLKSRKAQKKVQTFTQAERMWSRENP